MKPIQKIVEKTTQWYQAKIFPVLMDKNLRRKEIIQERINILSYAKGNILEHGKAQNRFLQFLQKIANPFFQSLACGCNVNRDYFKQMKEQGFIMQEESIRKCKIQPSFVAGHLYRAIATVRKE